MNERQWKKRYKNLLQLKASCIQPKKDDVVLLYLPTEIYDVDTYKVVGKIFRSFFPKNYCLIMTNDADLEFVDKNELICKIEELSS